MEEEPQPLMSVELAVDDVGAAESDLPCGSILMVDFSSRDEREDNFTPSSGIAAASVALAAAVMVTDRCFLVMVMVEGVVSVGPSVTVRYAESVSRQIIACT